MADDIRPLVEQALADILADGYPFTALPLVDPSTKLFPTPTMTELDGRYVRQALGARLNPVSPIAHPSAAIHVADTPDEFGAFTTTAWNGGSITWFGGDAMLNTVGAVTKPTGGSNPQSLYGTFYTDAPSFGIHVLAYGTVDVTVLVDRQPVTLRPYVLDPGAPGAKFVVVDGLDAGVPHEVVVILGPTAELIQLVATFGRHFWAAPKPPFTVALVGDSYTDIGIGPYYGGMARTLYLLTGWEIVQLGQGGTGYTNEGLLPDGSKPDPSKSVYGADDRLAALRHYAPDVVVVVGSVNDGSAPSATLTAAAAAYYDALSDLPIVVVGVEPLGVGGSGAANDAIRAAADAAPNVIAFVDWWGEDWLTGTGSTANPAGDGNQDYFIGSDNVHPNEDGYRYLGPRLVGKIAAAAIRV